MQLPAWLIAVTVVAVLAAIAGWGIAESVTVAAVVTVLEIGGLLTILWVGRGAVAEASAGIEAVRENWDSVGWPGLASGAVLALYAFIGFEDMANVAEEVNDPARDYPRAIVATLVATALLYVGVGFH